MSILQSKGKAECKEKSAMNEAKIIFLSKNYRQQHQARQKKDKKCFQFMIEKPKERCLRKTNRRGHYNAIDDRI